MKTRIGFYVYQILITGILFTFANSCKKDDDTGIPLLSTSEVTKITQITAKSGGTITSDEGFFVTARGICWNSIGEPNINDNKTSDGSGAGSFTSELTGLSAGATYFVRAYATNSEGTGYGSTKVFQTIGSTFTDSRDGNVYKIVTIGDQVWMAENLKYLPSVSGPETGSQTISYYYVYGYFGTNVQEAKLTEYYQKYGVLYNWPAAMNGAAGSTANPSGVQGVCPKGWHLPSDAEWTQLTDYLGGESVAGGKLKESGISHWVSPNTGATNESGFNALPGGLCNGNGLFYFGGFYTGCWSTTENSTDALWIRAVGYNFNYLERATLFRKFGCSIRCVKD